MQTLFNTWPWNRIWIRFLMWVPGLGNAIATYIFSWYAGPVAYWLLSISFFAFLLAFIYAKVCQRIQKKITSFDKPILLSDGLIALSLKVHSPGAIVLTEQALVLAPAFGAKDISIPLAQIDSVTRSNALGGRTFTGKIALHIKCGEESYHFAVEKESATAWIAKLC